MPIGMRTLHRNGRAIHVGRDLLSRNQGAAAKLGRGMDDAPLRGAAPVNDEFEVGYDAPFERSWRRAELIGQAVMLGFVALALSGLLGRGPFSHDTARTPDGLLSVDYEPVARQDTPTTITLHIAPALERNGVADVQLASTVIEPFGFERAAPIPAATRALADGLTLSFAVQPDQESLVRLAARPAGAGPIHLRAQVGGETLAWTQVVLP
jgi:hypothetical protein